MMYGNSSPTYTGSLRCNLPACTQGGLTEWFSQNQSNRGLTVINTQTGEVLGVLVDDTDPTRFADVATACESTRGLVLVTVAQGEPSGVQFHCNHTAGIALTLREFYPYWNGARQLPWSSFVCNREGWVVQDGDWGWPNLPGVPSSMPATPAQTQTETNVLTRKCPVMTYTYHNGPWWVSGTEAEF